MSMKTFLTTTFWSLFTILVMMPSAQAQNIKDVVSTSPAWDTFTNRDGSGLYHEILREVFALYGIPVRHEYSKSNRSEELVLQNIADMMTCDDKAQPPLELARVPMYVNDFYVFFKKDRIGPWKGDESLLGREILGQPTYYAAENFKVPVKIKEVATGVQALSMILMDRSDFYVDDLTLIQQSIKENTIPYQEEDFDIRKIGRRAYRPLFNSTPRGRQLKKMYEDGMLTLHKSGKLRPIYKKWGHQYPDFDAY